MDIYFHGLILACESMNLFILNNKYPYGTATISIGSSDKVC